MINTIRPTYLLLTVISLGICIKHGHKLQAEPLSQSEKIAELYIKSLPIRPSSNSDLVHNRKKALQPLSISRHMLYTAVFTQIFKDASMHQATSSRPVITKNTWHDLHLFYGTIDNLSHSFISKINRTRTLLGECALCLMIGNPTDDIKELKQRQSILKHLSKNQALFKQLQLHLGQYKHLEHNIISLWTDVDPLYSEGYSSGLKKLFYTNNPSKNRSYTFLQSKKICRDIIHICAKSFSLPILGMMIGEFFAIPLFSDMPRHVFYRDVFPFFVPIQGIPHAYQLGKLGGFDSVYRIMFVLMPVAMTATTLLMSYNAWTSYVNYSQTLRSLALRMADIQDFLKILNDIDKTLKNNPIFYAIYREKAQAIDQLLHPNRKNNNHEIALLQHYLRTLPFRSWSYIFDNAGKLLACYQLFLTYKHIFHNAMYELGQLDSYLSMATLLNQSGQNPDQSHYTFSNLLYAETHKSPQLRITGLWNPMLPKEKCITNDINMGDDASTKHIILTGPNAGGKSTFLTGITYSILLSQTFGIAPAKNVDITPFKNINTYIEITDDIAAGKSLFMAEVHRLKNHLESIASLKEHEFSFTIFDEPFRGTAPIEGSATAYACFNDIAEHPNHLSIIATHYPLIMTLEKKEPLKHFKNYQVDIKYDQNQQMYYTYKIIPGISTKNIAMNILEKEGYSKKIIETAKSIISTARQQERRVA